MDNLSSENKQCRYCGEKMPDYYNRCSWCGSLQNSGFETGEQRENSSEAISSEKADFLVGTDGTAEINRDRKDKIKQLSNKMKVFIAVLCTIVPCLGQLIGVIMSIAFINTGEDDRKSFGLSLLGASIVIFAVWCLNLYIALVFYTTFLLLIPCAYGLLQFFFSQPICHPLNRQTFFQFYVN